MAYQHKNNSGSAFKNRYKQDGDNKPDFTGDGLIDGVLKRFAIWKKSGNNGEFLSIKIDDPRPSQGGNGGGSPQQRREPDPYDQGDASF